MQKTQLNRVASAQAYRAKNRVRLVSEAKAYYAKNRSRSLAASQGGGKRFHAGIHLRVVTAAASSTLITPADVKDTIEYQGCW